LTPFRVKSFTGVIWGAPTWGSSKRLAGADGVSTDGKSLDSSQTSETVKRNVDSSAIASEKSNSGEADTPMANGIDAAASPAVAVA
jgi:INO80 complex subunit Ies4